AGENLTENDRLACNNRRFLFGIMTQAGFQPYFAEWWHFNAPESQMGAATAGLDYATFGAVGLDESQRAHENTRLHIHQEALKLQREGDPAVARTAGLAVVRTALQMEILAVIRDTGDPKLVEDWPAEMIAPP
ncbi:MAG TPA: M15 family metallopeptidase, partial [Ktedonobacteraceae bacterium]|nr:M15 family metallopeptidase [Ktedonobacteraceae bacterium]